MERDSAADPDEVAVRLAERAVRDRIGDGTQRRPGDPTCIGIAGQRESARWPDMEFPDFRSAADQKIYLLIYALCRLEKINNEREYCFTYFNSVAPTRDIEARFSISKSGRKMQGHESFSTQIRGGAVSSKASRKIYLPEVALKP